MSKKTKSTKTPRPQASARGGAERRSQTEAIVRPFRRATEEESAVMADQMRQKLAAPAGVATGEYWSGPDAEQRKRQMVKVLVDAFGIAEGVRHARQAGAWPCGDVVEELLGILRNDLHDAALAKVADALRLTYDQGCIDGRTEERAWRTVVTGAASKALSAKSQRRYEAIAKHYRSQPDQASVTERLQATAREFDVSPNTVRNALARTK